MERIQVLIDKLQQQYQQKENASSMLATVQMLQNELATLQKGNKVLGTSKVAVLMPNGHAFNRYSQESLLVDTKQVALESEVKKPVAPQKQPDTLKQEYYAPKPAAVEAPHPQQAITHNVPLFDLHIDTVIEAPTLMQQQIHKEKRLLTN